MNQPLHEKHRLQNGATLIVVVGEGAAAFEVLALHDEVQRRRATPDCTRRIMACRTTAATHRGAMNRQLAGAMGVSSSSIAPPVSQLASGTSLELSIG